MIRKTRPSTIEPSLNLRTDYTLMAFAIAAALLALVYLILT
jgi:hypothetical protein